METLSNWYNKICDTPKTIECPEMHIHGGRTGKKPVFTGPGQINIKSSTHIDFMMHAIPTDTAEALTLMEKSRKNPYETLDQFLLNATDYGGTEWNCGWIQPRLKGLPKTGWPLTGRIEGLLTMASGDMVSKHSSIELIFSPSFQIPTEKQMITVSSIEGKEINKEWSAGKQTVRVLDTEVNFFYSTSGNALWLTAETSEELQHPYAENWVSEPLRILLGQLIYPRLIARNLGDGSAQIWLRASPPKLKHSEIVSMTGGNAASMGSMFWDLYSALLRFIAKACDEDEHPNFEPNQVTRFYHELIQATQGSRWVLCMTLSSVAEGLLRLIIPPIRGQRYKADNNMKGLVEQKILKNEDRKAWTKVRHAVMHGYLVSPWADREEDDQIRHLIDLVHRLTHKLIDNPTEA